MKKIFPLFMILFIAHTAAALEIQELARRGNLSLLKKKIQTVAQANSVGKGGEPLLISAVSSGNLELVKFLLQKGAKINALDSSDQSALFYAISEGNENLSLFLIDHGADVAAVSGRKKENLLFEAVRLGQFKTLNALLKKKPTLANDVNSEGESALFESVRSAQSEAAKILIRHGANKDLRNKEGKTAAELANPTTDQTILLILEKEKGP